MKFGNAFKACFAWVGIFALTLIGIVLVGDASAAKVLSANDMCLGGLVLGAGLIDMMNFRSLSEAANNIIVPGKLLLEKVWGWGTATPRRHLTNKIDIDIIDGDLKLAPFVSPIEGGVVVNKQGRTTNTIDAPRIRLKTRLNPADFNERAPGASVFIGDQGAYNTFKQQKIALELQGLKDKVMRRMHWMACQAISTGAVNVSQDNIAFAIDFLVPSGNKPTLTSTAKWDAPSTRNIPGDIRAWNRLIPGGATVGFMGYEAADIFVADATVRDIMKAQNIKAGTLAMDNSNYLGRVFGIDWYEVNEYYTSDAGVQTEMFDKSKVALVNTNMRFDMNLAAIQDLEAGGDIVTDFFAKTDIQKDPSAMWLIVESDPLPAIVQPRSVVCATVK